MEEKQNTTQTRTRAQSKIENKPGADTKRKYDTDPIEDLHREEARKNQIIHLRGGITSGT